MRKLAIKSIILLSVFLLSSVLGLAQETQREKNRHTNPTVTGGTGLFTVYDASTLKKGEYNFGFFVNNYDREPGDVDITQGILNVGFGVTDRLEVFAASVFRQQLVSGSPDELKGFNALGPGSITIVPRLAGSGPAFNFATLPGGYLNDHPFFGRSFVKVGNTTVGAKYRFTSQDSWLGVALLGFAQISSFRPSTEFPGNGSGLIDGAGAGATDYGVMLAVTPRLGRASFNMNAGYVKTGDPKVNDIKLVDRRDKVIAAIGFDYAYNQYVQFISELTSDIYVGSGTPNVNPVNPVDVTVGARFTPLGKDRKFFMSLGGAYRYMLNNSNERRPENRKGDFHGYVAELALGYRKVTPPDPCLKNVAPTVSVSADKLEVTEKTAETVTFTAVGKDVDPADTTLTYMWSTSSGSIDGNGSTVTWNPGTSAPGPVEVRVTVRDTCNHEASASASVNVKKGNTCPTVTVSASESSLRAGSDAVVTLTARANDPDGQNLTYTWTSTSGSVSGSGDTVTLDTKGMGPGTVTVSVRVSDGICDGSDSASFRITEPPPPPQRFETACDGIRCANPPFKKNISRIDNQCKGILDEVATRLQGDATAVCIIDGHSEAGEKAGTALQRAQKAKDYLVSKGIDPNRIEVRSFDNQRPDASAGDRRINVYVVPEGAQRPE